MAAYSSNFSYIFIHSFLLLEKIYWAFIVSLWACILARETSYNQLFYSLFSCNYDKYGYKKALVAVSIYNMVQIKGQRKDEEGEKEDRRNWNARLSWCNLHDEQMFSDTEVMPNYIDPYGWILISFKWDILNHFAKWKKILTT
jgi:hypothetical protein